MTFTLMVIGMMDQKGSLQFHQPVKISVTVLLDRVSATPTASRWGTAVLMFASTAITAGKNVQVMMIVCQNILVYVVTLRKTAESYVVHTPLLKGQEHSVDFCLGILQIKVATANYINGKHGSILCFLSLN
mmetsp:Transcript_21647/g.28071  ORF Transcript_21647/g.28071 Transcript_21647/m.28071 type:complete len:131 (-) Transcript_21647:157-549(-)